MIGSAMRPPVGRPGEPPKSGTWEAPPAATDTPAPPEAKRELPSWRKWSTYGDCTHDPECKKKLLIGAGVGLAVLIGIALWTQHRK